MKKIIAGVVLSLAWTFAFAAGQSNCTTNPDSCVSQPVAHACAAGYHWSTAGSNQAHCVLNDYTCPTGQGLTHDYLGNPSCYTCASSSTETGSCQSGYTGTAYRTKTIDSCTNTTSYSSWDYSSCTPACGTSTSTQSGSCPSGYTGTASRTQTYDSCTGSTTYGSWDYSSCTVACGTSTTTESGACQAGYTGTASRTKTVDSCTGTTTYGSWDYSSCTTCTTTSTESAACPSGYTGTEYRSVTKNSCTGSTTYGIWDTSGCTVAVAACPAPGKYCRISNALEQNWEWGDYKYIASGSSCIMDMTMVGEAYYTPDNPCPPEYPLF